MKKKKNTQQNILAPRTVEPYFTLAILVFLVYIYSVMLSLTVAFITKKAVPSLNQYRNSQTSPQYIHYLVKITSTDLNC